MHNKYAIEITVDVVERNDIIEKNGGRNKSAMTGLLSDWLLNTTAMYCKILSLRWHATEFSSLKIVSWEIVIIDSATAIV